MRTLEIRGRRAIRATGPSQQWQKAVVLSQGETGTLVGKCARLVGCASSMCQFMEPKGFYRSAGPLAQDAATAVASVTPAVEHDVTVREPPVEHQGRRHQRGQRQLESSPAEAGERRESSTKDRSPSASAQVNATNLSNGFRNP